VHAHQVHAHDGRAGARSRWPGRCTRTMAA